MKSRDSNHFYVVLGSLQPDPESSRDACVGLRSSCMS